MTIQKLPTIKSTNKVFSSTIDQGYDGNITSKPENDNDGVFKNNQQTIRLPTKRTAIGYQETVY